MSTNPLAGKIYVADPKKPASCSACGRDPARMNSEFSECSHVDCPHRRRAWSERPSRAELFKGPWPKKKGSDPEPLA